MTPSQAAKSTYVFVMRALRTLAKTTGIYQALENRLPNRRAHWWLSLFAIYDIDAMVKLDVPWWSYDAIDEVNTFLAGRPKARVFEYGSGASTIWAALRAEHVTSVEHDESWHPIISNRLREFDNVDLRLMPPDDTFHADFGSQKPGNASRSFKAYVSAIEDSDTPFDLIIIDGRARVACLKHALGKLADDGMIVFDNSGRSEYRDPINSLNAHVQTYRGRVPSLPYPDQTTLIRPTPA